MTFFRIFTFAWLAVVALLGCDAYRLSPSSARASQDATLQSNFAAGNFLIHATMRQQYWALKDPVYTYLGREEHDGSLLEQVASVGTPPDVVSQMRNWNSTGRLYGALSTSHVSPMYKGSTLYSELGYLLDGRQCTVLSAASFDQYIQNYKLMQGEDARVAEMDRVARSMIENAENFLPFFREHGVNDNMFKFYFSGGAEPSSAYDGLKQLEEEHGDFVHFLTGTQRVVFDEAKKGLTQDVNAALRHKFVRKEWGGYTEIVADCPVEAVVGAVVTLPTWKGNTEFDVNSLTDIARSWIDRLGTEVPALHGRSLPIVHYVAGGGVDDKPQWCRKFCGDSETDFDDLEPARLDVLEWRVVGDQS